MLKKRIVKLIFPFLVSSIVLIFIYSQIDIGKILQSLKQASLMIVFATLGISVINNFLIAATRWKLMLNCLGADISWRELLFIQVGSDPLIGVLPFRFGEFSRVFYLAKVKKIPYAKSVLSIFCEYAFNLGALIIFIMVGAGLCLFYNSIFLTFFLPQEKALFVFCLCRYSFSGYIKNIYIKFNNKIFCPLLAYTKKAMPVFKNFKVIIFTIIYVGLELVIVYLLAQALGVLIPFYYILLFVPLVILISLIPVTFCGIGAREASILFLFAGLASREELFSLSILYFAVEYLFPMFVGLSLTGVYLNKIAQRQA
jgi:hypothetical protein